MSARYRRGSAHIVIGSHATHHGCPVGKFVFLFERVALWGKIVYLYFLRVNFARFVALGDIPL
jgi:hypothetical protein